MTNKHKLTDLELVTMLKERLSTHFSTGLCREIWGLELDNHITPQEYYKLIFIINLHINQEDKRTITDDNMMYTNYFWKLGHIEPRLKYLEYLIEKYSE